jgi:hypothetical protein
VVGGVEGGVCGIEAGRRLQRVGLQSKCEWRVERFAIMH